MTEQDAVEEEKRVIDGMSHEDMARLVLSAPFGHKYFTGETGLPDYFMDRFMALEDGSVSVEEEGRKGE